MGAVNLSLDIRLIESLKEVLPISLFVETGTFKGDSVAAIYPYFDKLITIEHSEPLWREATARFKGIRNVEVLLGDSPNVLAGLRDAFAEASTLFWLDAHWCVAENESGHQSQCPLLDEIRAIGSLGDSSVVLIDDARLFMSLPPEPYDSAQWPLFNQIIAALLGLSTKHELMIINDVIVFYPKVAQEVVKHYARRWGLDWLLVCRSLQENQELRQENEELKMELQKTEKGGQHILRFNDTLVATLEERDIAIRQLKETIATLKSVLLERERYIETALRK